MWCENMDAESKCALSEGITWCFPMFSIGSCPMRTKFAGYVWKFQICSSNSFSLVWVPSSLTWTPASEFSVVSLHLLLLFHNSALKPERTTLNINHSSLFKNAPVPSRCTPWLSPKAAALSAGLCAPCLIPCWLDAALHLMSPVHQKHPKSGTQEQALLYSEHDFPLPIGSADFSPLLRNWFNFTLNV